MPEAKFKGVEMDRDMGDGKTFDFLTPSGFLLEPHMHPVAVFSIVLQLFNFEASSLSSPLCPWRTVHCGYCLLELLCAVPCQLHL